MSRQVEAVRDGVHLEHVALNCWRLTGKETVYCVREERRMSRAKMRRLHLTDNRIVVWEVRQTAEEKAGVPFQTAGSALAHAFAKAGSIPLEL